MHLTSFTPGKDNRTVQTTVNFETETPLLLKLKSSPSSTDKIVSLMKTIADQNLFTGDDALVCFKRLEKKLFFVLENDQSPDKALKLLSRIILKCVRPALLKEMDDERALQLFEIDEEIQKIMQDTLPKNVTAENYLEAIREKIKNKKIAPLQNKSDNRKLSEKVASLILQLEKSETLSSEELQNLVKWKKEIPCQVFDQLESNEQKQQGSILLCLLLMDVLEPALCKSTEGHLRQVMINFQKELKTLISSTLIVGTTIDDFLNLCKGFVLEKKAFAEKVELIEQIFNQALKSLYENANATDNKILENFYTIKAKLLMLTNERVMTANKANDTLTILTGKVDFLIEVLIKDSNDLSLLADNLGNYQITFHKMVQDCQALFKDFKV